MRQISNENKTLSYLSSRLMIEKTRYKLEENNNWKYVDRSSVFSVEKVFGKIKL